MIEAKHSKSHIRYYNTSTSNELRFRVPLMIGDVVFWLHPQPQLALSDETIRRWRSLTTFHHWKHQIISQWIFNRFTDINTNQLQCPAHMCIKCYHNFLKSAYTLAKENQLLGGSWRKINLKSCDWAKPNQCHEPNYKYWLLQSKTSII